MLSPSFVLVRQYRSGFLPLVHVDVYRLGSVNELRISRPSIWRSTAFWSSNGGDALEGEIPEDHLLIDFVVEEDGSRTLRLEPSGNWVERDLGLVA